MTSRVKVALVHQGIWNMEKLSMPPALGYVEAYAQKDEEIWKSVDFRIFNYRGRVREEICTVSFLRKREVVPRENARHVAGLPDASLRSHPG